MNGALPGGALPGAGVSDTGLDLADVKLHLRIAHDAEDALLIRLAEAAVNWCEKYQGRKYLQVACVDYLDAWPKVIRPRWSPVESVTSITYIDTGGAEQTWAAAEYRLDGNTEPARIVPAYGYDYPDVRGDINGICLTYIAGYGEQFADVPQEIRNAIYLLIAHWYSHREAAFEGVSLHEIPLGVRGLLGLERTVMPG